MLNLLSYQNTIYIPGKLNIWPHQQKANPSLIESMIRQISGHITKIDASELKVIEVDTQNTKKFLNDNHIAGHVNSTFRYGLSDGEEVLCLLTLETSKYANNFSLRALRFANKKDLEVVNGLSKILDYIKSKHDGSILAYSDLLFSKGAEYECAGFTSIGQTARGYFWEKDGNIIQSVKTKKQQLLNLLGSEIDLSKSETALMSEAGYNKVFDLGHLRWNFKINDDFNKDLRLKFNYVYRISRPEIDDRFYIGVHSTNNIDDGYLGSGNLIVSSVQKYGKSKHQKEILKVCSTRNEALDFEKDIVTKKLINDSNCMNLSVGGGNIFMPNGTTTGKIWVWNQVNGKEMFIEESWYEQIAKSGWIKGRNPKYNNRGGAWFFDKDGKASRTKGALPEGATLGRNGVTADYRWVTRNGVQTLVKEIQDGDEVGFKQVKTNKGLRKIVKDGVTSLVSAEEEAKLLKEGASKPKPPTLGKIGMRSPDGVKKLVSPTEARALVKEGWSLAAKSLKGVSPAVRELAQELGLRIPKKKHNPS